MPNLTPSSWDADYDPRPGGSGSLTYRVDNTGTALAPKGANIALVLSTNQDINNNDYLVIYEPIQYDLGPGAYVYRDEASAIRFNFPDEVDSGTYYMALVVDDTNILKESNENDNISLGSNTISIENSSPDLIVYSWYAAPWDNYGKWFLTYEVNNDGASAVTSSDWYVNLILDTDQRPGNGNEIYLFYETGQELLPGYQLYRDWENPAYFNIYEDMWGYSVPSGTYYMALWVDDLNAVAESNEINNGSYSWGTIPISSHYRSGLDKSSDNVEESGNDLTLEAYNGRTLPSKDLVWKKVKISKSSDGSIRMTGADIDIKPPQVGEGECSPSKSLSSKAKLIFPNTKKYLMQ